MKENNLKIFSSLIVKLSLMSEPRTTPGPELLKVKFIKLREKNDMRDWDQTSRVSSFH